MVWSLSREHMVLRYLQCFQRTIRLVHYAWGTQRFMRGDILGLVWFQKWKCDLLAWVSHGLLHPLALPVFQCFVGHISFSVMDVDVDLNWEIAIFGLLSSSWSDITVFYTYRFSDLSQYHVHFFKTFHTVGFTNTHLSTSINLWCKMHYNH